MHLHPISHGKHVYPVQNKLTGHKYETLLQYVLNIKSTIIINYINKKNIKYYNHKSSLIISSSNHCLSIIPSLSILGLSGYEVDGLLFLVLHFLLFYYIN